MLLFVQLTALLAYPAMETATLGEWRDAGTGAVRRRRSPGPLPRRPGRPRDTGADVGRRAPRRPGRAARSPRRVWPASAPIEFWAPLLHALYFYTGYGLLRYMFADNWVTRDELYATGAAFTVVA